MSSKLTAVGVFGVDIGLYIAGDKLTPFLRLLVEAFGGDSFELLLAPEDLLDFLLFFAGIFNIPKISPKLVPIDESKQSSSSSRVGDVESNVLLELEGLSTLATLGCGDLKSFDSVSELWRFLRSDVSEVSLVDEDGDLCDEDEDDLTSFLSFEDVEDFS